MNRRILYTGLISMSLLLYGIASCTSDEFRLIPSQEEEEEETRPPVTVMTKSDVNLSEPEDSIATVRWIVLSPAGEVLFNEIKNAAEINALPDANAGKAGKQVEISFTALLTTHYAGFFMIANELSTWNLGSYTVGSTVSSETLKGKVLTYSNNSLMQVGTLIPMAGIYEHLYIAADGKTYKVANDPSTKQNPGDIERLYARVSLTIDADTANLLNKDPLDIKSLRVMRMPKQSYLAPLLYTGTDFVDGGYVPIITSGPAKNYTAYNPLTKGNSFDGDFSFYIPEYILSDTSKYTYMKAVVELRGGLDSLEYRIAIGDSVADGNNAWMLNSLSPGRSYKHFAISRNTHYKFKAHITGFNKGGEQEIDVKAYVLGWEAVDTVKVDIREYILTVSQDEFKVSPMAFDGVIDVVTDHPAGWSAVVVTPSSPGNRTTLSETYTGKPSGQLKFHYNGTAITTPADTIKVTAGKVTKKIIVKN